MALFIVIQKKSENILKEKNVKITKQAHAFNGYVSSYVEILNSFNPELQLKATESAIKSKLINLLTQLNGFKWITTLALVFKKMESDDKIEYDTFHLNLQANININESDIDDVFESIYTTITWNIQKFLGRGSGLIIDNISISKCNPSAGVTYIRLPKELDHPRKGLIFKILMIMNASNGVWSDA